MWCVGIGRIWSGRWSEATSSKGIMLNIGSSSERPREWPAILNLQEQTTLSVMESVKACEATADFVAGRAIGGTYLTIRIVGAGLPLAHRVAVSSRQFTENDRGQKSVIPPSTKNARWTP